MPAGRPSRTRIRARARSSRSSSGTAIRPARRTRRRASRTRSSSWSPRDRDLTLFPPRTPRPPRSGGRGVFPVHRIRPYPIHTMMAPNCIAPLAALLLQISATPADVPAQASIDGGASAHAVSDAPLEPYRLELLELAFQTAATYPETPHVKNRARAIESVALTCYELDQPRRALRYAEDISNWRRGAGYADFALYSAENGALAEVRDYLERALEVSATSDDVEAQDWRGDRIQAKVARTYALLGEIEQAERLESDLDKPAASQVDLVQASSLDEHEFEAHMATLDELVATGDFDLLQHALESYIELFERFYANEDYLSEIEDRIATACRKLPVMIHIEALERL